MTATRSATTKKTAAKKTAAKKTTSAQVSTASDFKKRKRGTPLPLPTGLVVVARRVDVKDFIFNNYDVPNPLMEKMMAALDKGKKADVAKMVGVDGGDIDLDMIRDMYEMVDTVVREVVVEPKVHPNPEPGEPEDEDLVYCRDFDDEDKMFLFQWATGGTADIASFRGELAQSLAALGQGQEPAGSAKRAAGSRSK